MPLQINTQVNSETTTNTVTVTIITTTITTIITIATTAIITPRTRAIIKGVGTTTLEIILKDLTTEVDINSQGVRNLDQIEGAFNIADRINSGDFMETSNSNIVCYRNDLKTSKTTVHHDIKLKQRNDWSQLKPHKNRLFWDSCPLLVHRGMFASHESTLWRSVARCDVDYTELEKWHDRADDSENSSPVVLSYSSVGAERPV